MEIAESPLLDPLPPARLFATVARNCNSLVMEYLPVVLKPHDVHGIEHVRVFMLCEVRLWSS